MAEDKPSSFSRRTFLRHTGKGAGGALLASTLGGCDSDVPTAELGKPLKFHYDDSDCVMTPVKGIEASNIADMLFKAGYKMLLVTDSDHGSLANAEMLSSIIRSATPTHFFVEQTHGEVAPEVLATDQVNFEAHRNDDFLAHVYPDELAYAPRDDTAEFRQRYFDARRGMLISARDKKAHVIAFDSPENTPQQELSERNATVAMNRSIVAYDANEIASSLRTYNSPKEFTDEERKQLVQIFAGAAHFNVDLVDYVFPKNNISTVDQIEPALQSMNSSEFTLLKSGFEKLLKNIYGRDVSKLSAEELNDLYLKRRKELEGETQKLEDARDIVRDEYMATQIANADKSDPSMKGISFLGIGHFKHLLGVPERKIFPELVQEKLPGSKIARINIIPVPQRAGEHAIEDKFGTRVFMGGTNGSDITIFCDDPIQGYNVSWYIKETPEIPYTQKLLFGELTKQAPPLRNTSVSR